MPEIKTVKQVGRVYRAELDDGSTLDLYDSTAVFPAQPAPKVAVQTEAEHEKKETVPGRNPFTKKFWNLTQQAQLKKKNPTEYARLKALAAD